MAGFSCVLCLVHKHSYQASFISIISFTSHFQFSISSFLYPQVDVRMIVININICMLSPCMLYISRSIQVATLQVSDFIYRTGYVNANVIKTSGSESRPRKVELASAHKKRDDHRKYFTHNNEACKNPYKTTLPH